MRTTTEVIHDHLLKRLAGDTETDIRENYADEVVLLTGSGEYRGRDGARAAADELARLVGDARYVYEQTVVSGDYAFLEWSAEGPGRVVCDGADSYAVHDGRIVMQSIHYTPRDA
jgi:hypothetical protein